jgi:hypothetical protein
VKKRIYLDIRKKIKNLSNDSPSKMWAGIHETNIFLIMDVRTGKYKIVKLTMCKT